MANGTNEDQQLDEFGFPIPSEEELSAERQRIENERKKAATAIQLSGAASALEGALPSALPTQTAPLTPPAGFEPALMAEQERIKQAAAARAQIPEQNQIIPPPDTQGRMYMGPNIGAADLARIPEGGRISLMPPAVTPPASRLEQLQALDRPGSMTIGIREEPPYSDASLAASQNRMKYEAIQKFMAGDRSPAIVMAAFGGGGGSSRAVQSMFPRPISAGEQARMDLAKEKFAAQQEAASKKYSAADSRLDDELLRRDTSLINMINQAMALPEDKRLEVQSRLTSQREAIRKQREALAKKYAGGSSSAAPASAYKVGGRYGNMRYKGGDPSVPTNWEKVQ